MPPVISKTPIRTVMRASLTSLYLCGAAATCRAMEPDYHVIMEMNGKQLAKELFARLQPGMTIGDAVLEAKRAYAATHPHQKDVILGWTLFGVPGLRM
jgi:hypothetical protein